MPFPACKFPGLAAIAVFSGCASVFDEDGALATAPYYIEDDGQIVIEARVNDQGPFRFALDTAASISVIFDRLRDKIEPEVLADQSVIIHGAVSSEKFPLLRIDSLQVGREAWTDTKMASMPGNTEIGGTIDGILGVDFLRQYTVGFSTQDRVVRLYAPDLVASRSYRRWRSVPLQPEFIGKSAAALYFFEIEIDDLRVPALFDLGAGLNIINWSAARSIGRLQRKGRDDERFWGVIESVPFDAQYNAKGVKTAALRWQNEIFWIADLKIFEAMSRSDSPAAIVGAGLFTQRDFVVDFVRSRIIVKVAVDGGAG